MKNISILKTIRIVVLVAFVMQMISLFFGKRFGESGEKIFMTIITVLFLIILVLAFGFGKKLEKEKIEREQRKSTARK